jgi:hypothetical protein
MRRHHFWLAALLPACSAVAVGPGFTVDGGAGDDAGAPPDRAVVAPVDSGFVLPVDAGSPPFDNGFVFPVDAGGPTDDGLVFPVDRGVPVDRPEAVDRPDAGPPRLRVVGGRRCASDEDCLTATADLTCVALAGGRVCTSATTCQQGTTAEEEEQCGSRFSTCLHVGNTTSGARLSFCTRACVASAASEATGACPASSVCTTNWLRLGATQTETQAGCSAFCVTDADCAGASGGGADLARCNTRLGQCAAAPSNPALGADGTRCNPMSQQAGVPQCRGTCFLLATARPTEGLCGSFVDLGATQQCADDPKIEPRGIPGDELGLCLFRACVDNAGCGGGLVCVRPESGGAVRTDLDPSCGYPTALQPLGIPAGGG